MKIWNNNNINYCYFTMKYKHRIFASYTYLFIHISYFFFIKQGLNFFFIITKNEMSIIEIRTFALIFDFYVKSVFSSLNGHNKVILHTCAENTCLALMCVFFMTVKKIMFSNKNPKISIIHNVRTKCYFLNNLNALRDRYGVVCAT